MYILPSTCGPCMKAGPGKVTLTWVSSVATAFPLKPVVLMVLFLATMSRVKTTSRAVNGVPSENFTPGRRVIDSSVPLAFHA
jgi:hypothetical protein